MKMSIHLDYKEVVSSFFRVNSFSKHCGYRQQLKVLLA